LEAKAGFGLAEAAAAAAECGFRCLVVVALAACEISTSMRTKPTPRSERKQSMRLLTDQQNVSQRNEYYAKQKGTFA
jgi:hypothetical protein